MISKSTPIENCPIRTMYRIRLPPQSMLILSRTSPNAYSRFIVDRMDRPPGSHMETVQSVVLEASRLAGLVSLWYTFGPVCSVPTSLGCLGSEAT